MYFFSSVKSSLGILILILLFSFVFITGCKFPGLGGSAKVQTETITYRQGSNTFEGFYAHSPKGIGKKPGVIIVPQWKGITSHEKDVAVKLAGLGYDAFAVDLYGKNVRPTNNTEAANATKPFKKNRKLYRERLRLGIAAFTNKGGVDPNRLAVVGYCFGGMGALELARNGDTLRGVISVHGNLDTPNVKESTNFRTKILVLHGADDPVVPEKEVLAFQREMRTGNADWQMNFYGDAVHGFTQLDSGTNAGKRAAYHEPSAKRAWEALSDFLREVFN